MPLIDKEKLQAFLLQEQLPPHFKDTISRFYLPLAQRLLDSRSQSGSTLSVGIHGAQGTGKSTLARLLTLILRQQELNVANLSIDDFYLSHDARAELAQTVHPLMATRGVPGTHDLDLLYESFELLADPAARGTVALPRFNKATDDSLPKQEWARLYLPVDVILLEGWFIGIPPQHDDELLVPVNNLEATEDPVAVWRRYVNASLLRYQDLFQQIDFLIMLRPPSFDCVYQWRALQERKLAATVNPENTRLMDTASLHRFIAHFERLTRHGLNNLPRHADLVFDLDHGQQVVASTK